MMALIELERVGANAELVDDATTLLTAHALFESVRERLRSLQPNVSACLQAADEVCLNGADILSPEEFHSLRKHRDQLKDANHNLHKHTDVVSDRLSVASDLLGQFDAQTSAFQLWMNDTNREISELQAASGDHRRLRECQAKAQSITKDVVSHADQMKAVRSLAARIHDELRGYMLEVNALRQNRQLPLHEYKTGQVGATVTRLQDEYDALTRRCEQLHSLHTVVEDLSARYQTQVSSTKEWLSKLDMEIAAAAAADPTSSDPADIQRQLDAIRALNARMVEERRRLDDARAAGQQLLTAVESTDGHGRQADELNNEWSSMEERYLLVTESLQNQANALQALHTQSQGVRNGMDEMLDWLGATENELSTAKPLPLDKDKLAEQRNEQQLLQSNIESRRPALDQLRASINQLIVSSPSAANAGLTEKLADADKRYKLVARRCSVWGDAVQDAQKQLDAFHDDAAKFDQSLATFVADLQNTNPDADDINEYNNRLSALEPSHRSLIIAGENLLNLPNATDAASVRDLLRNAENRWTDTHAALEKRLKESELRRKQLGEYETQRDRVLFWLKDAEQRLEELPLAPLLIPLVEEQRDTVQLMVKEHGDFKPDMDLMNRLGSALIADQQQPETPTPNSKNKRQSTTGLSPGSNVSSGFSSYDHNMGAAAGEEMTGVQRELFDANHRYDLIGLRLKDRTAELATVLQRLSDYDVARRDLERWTAERRKAVADLPLPLSRDDATRLLAELDRLNLQTKKERSRFDDARGQAHELTRLKDPELVAGLTQLRAGQEELEAQWDALQEDIRRENQRLLDAKDMHGNYDHLDKWLSAKQKMMIVLGPVSSDAKMLNNQLQQLEVLKDEVESQKPSWIQINDVAQDLVSHASGDAAETRQLVDHIDGLNRRWSDLQQQIEDREQSMLKARGAGSEFALLEREFRSKMVPISSQIEQFAAAAPTQQEMDAHLAGLEQLRAQMEEREGDIAGLQMAMERLQEVSGDDPSVKTEILEKFHALQQPFDEMKKKLDSLQRAAQNAKAEGKQFERQFDDLLEWMDGSKARFDQMEPVSANAAKLRQQSIDFDPFYHDVLEHEGEASLIKAKARDALKKADNSTLKEKLNALDERWPPLLTATKDRRSRLEKASDIANQWADTKDALAAKLDSDRKRLHELDDTQEEGDLSPDAIADRLSALRQLHADIDKRQPEVDAAVTFAGRLQKVAPGVDADNAATDADALASDWRGLETDVKRLVDETALNARLWDTFNNTLHETEAALGRCDADADVAEESGEIGAVSKDRLRAVLAELDGPVNRKLAALRGAADDLKHTNRSLPIAVEDAVDGLSEHATSLRQRLRDKVASLDNAEELVNDARKRSSSLQNELKKMRSELSGLSPIARDSNHLQSQELEVDELLLTVDDKQRDLDRLREEWDAIAAAGRASPGEVAAAKQQLDNLQAEIDLLRAELLGRKKEIGTSRDNLDDLSLGLEDTHSSIMSTLASDVLQQPVSSVLAEVRAQLDALQNFKDDLQPTAKQVDQLLSRGHDLIKSAGPGVDTSQLDSELNKLGDAWNELKSRVTDRERKLDGALLGLGNYNDASKALLNWLEETEEMVANQKPPSADNKVVKAQLQGYDVILKHIDEKQSSVDGFVAMVEKVESLADGDAERHNLRDRADDIVRRYDDLVRVAHDRRDCLQEALELAEQWSDSLRPVVGWLDVTERKLQDLGSVPTDEDKLRAQIENQKMLQEEIDAQRPAFDDLVELCPRLAALVSNEDADDLESVLRTVVNRYDRLGSNAQACGVLLEEMAAGISAFLANTDALGEWIDDAEHRIAQFDPLSVYPDALQEQSAGLMALAEDVAEEQAHVTAIVEEGRDLCKHTSGDEAIALQSRLDNLRLRYSDLSKRTDQKLATMEESLPLAEQYHDGHQAVVEWLDAIESDLERCDQVPLEVQAQLIKNMEEDLSKWRPDVDQLNAIGARFAQLSPGEGAETLEAQALQMNRRFDAVSDQVQRRSERLDLALKNSQAMLGDLDDLIDWFHQAQDRMVDAGAAAADPDVIKQQLKNQRLLNDDIVSQKSRVRDLLAGAKKLVRDFNNAGEDAEVVQHKIDTAREMSETVAQLSQDRLSVLEQALPLAHDLAESFIDLNEWLTGLEIELENCPAVIPGHHPEGLMKQQVHNNELLNAVQAQKPLIDKFEKTAAALATLCGDEDAGRIQESAETIAGRYAALRENIRARGIALDDAVQESSQFSDKLDMMLANLEAAAGQVRNPEPISAHPDRIRNQIADNCALIDELEQKAGALQAVKDSAAEIIAQAREDDPAIAEITGKISLLDNLWEEIRLGTELRGRELEGTLGVAQQFWDELESCKDALRNLKKRIETAEPAACEPHAIQQQQFELSEIEAELREAAPLVDSLKATGNELCQLIGAHERPEVEQQVGELDQAWETVTGLFHKRHADLIEAMEKAMNFHDMLDGLQKWLEGAEGRVSGLPPVNAIGLDEIRAELDLVDALKKEVDDRAVEKEQLNQACAELCESASHEQVAAVRRPIVELNTRWNKLYAALNERQHKLERALLDLGQFQQAYDQLASWIGKTENTLDEIVPAPGDLKQTEIELAKHRVLQNDVHSHQNSVDTLNAAGKRMIAADPDSAETTQPKLDTLNDRWHDLHMKMDAKLAELEAAKSEAESFGGKVEDWMVWLDDVDAAVSSSKPTGGLPETARQQLDDFSVLEAEINERRPEIDAMLEAADEYLAQSPDNASSAMGQRLKAMKQKWDQMLTKTGDRRKKLEIALRDAEQFHELITAFSEWLAYAEQHLNSLPHVSRLIEPIAVQMENHRVFQDEVQQQREIMSELNTKGTKLQYYCEKKDAIPIKNLLVSAKHRFDKIVSRTADRTKQLDNGYHETKEFFETWAELCAWLDESGEWLREQTEQAASPERIKELLDKHKDMQRELGSRQPHYDDTSRRGRTLKDHAPHHEQPVIQDMLDTLREKWTSLCNGAVDRQRNLEEALLLSGQFKEAVAALMDWLDTSALPSLEDEERVHGDLDTVNRLIDQHKAFQTELKGRAANVATVRKAAQELLAAGDNGSTAEIRAQMAELDEKWSNLNELTEKRGARLDDALKDAEKLHKSAHTLLEWLSDMESKLKFAGALPDNEAELEQHLARLEVLNQEMANQRPMLDEALSLGHEIHSKCHPLAEQPIKHWLRILQARWDEVAAWSEQRNDRLKEQLKTVCDQDALIDDLLKWIQGKENELHDAEEAPVIEELELIEDLIVDHEEFEAELRGRQSDVDDATKGRKKPDLNENGSATDAKGGKGPKKAAPQRKMAAKHPKSQQLTERWRQLWLESMERGRKLQDLLAYMRELRRLENFSFDEWKHRYMDWTDGNKSRVSDFFRRIDKSGTGKVPREDFINGILASRWPYIKFPTTRLEMKKVADIFDKGDGLIDSKEFMAALRSDGRPKTPQKPKTDVEKINNEVHRQVQLCSCQNKYQIHQVGEGRYRFGDNQIKRMVRILRSTVMVRVGGGWEALDEFLVKHDPCRAKGKTNLELRDKYILPAGALDKMAAFDKVRKSPRTPPAHSHSSGSPSTSSVGTPRFASTPGPITKIREKTERSIPMYQQAMLRNGGGGASAGTSSLLSPADSEVSSITSRRSSDVTMHDHRGRGGGSKPGSRPSSRTDVLIERPSSRGSEASDSSLAAERPTRIPSLRGRKGVAFKPSPRASPQPGWK